MCVCCECVSVNVSDSNSSVSEVLLSVSETCCLNDCSTGICLGTCTSLCGWGRLTNHCSYFIIWHCCSNLSLPVEHGGKFTMKDHTYRDQYRYGIRWS